ncbi:hypothetical protein AGABI2DRAFT_196223 [Agaricus bisporus var. bisporus H97]|uniref:hypothetical protein n=1 Tax=Agaricus bisporus var. bisporus (strain H97 / ATCC MYA-4626 / FGSC 10389) TaxID=936046 RepID=UPI00029F6360|nr:hypothetical protein AGABI2DRAFT_196223 [Agaricus bisporus var. bisporus H97]EKV41732.1 hypothetical protein AGABI2DRAFT_196223 [Agaricus bisporus var. bisporus H97]
MVEFKLDSSYSVIRSGGAALMLPSVPIDCLCPDNYMSRHVMYTRSSSPDNLLRV